MISSVLYADGMRVAKVGHWSDFQNSWNHLWQVTMKGVEFDEGHKTSDLFDKNIMLLSLSGEKQVSFYGGQLEFSVNHSDGTSVNRSDGVELRVAFLRKEDKEVEEKMNIEIIDGNSSLKEVQEFCKKRENCTGCPIRGEMGCKIAKRPDHWDLDFRQEFDGDALAWMRVMLSGVSEDEKLWLGRESTGILYWKIENEDNSESRTGYLPREMFPRIQPGQKFDMRKVLEENGEE